MYPTLYSTEVVSVHSWGLMVLLAFAAACLVSGLRASRVGIDPDDLVPLYVLVGVAGMAGARLLHFVFAEPALFFGNPLVFFDVNHGGWAFYGGVIGGVGAGAVYARSRGVDVWKLADIAAASIMLGLAIGRVGCFLAGCCHGGVCETPVLRDLMSFPYGEVKLLDGFPYLGLRFEPGVGVGSLRGSVLFPTQLLEIGSGLLWFGVLSAVWRRWRRFDGQVLATMMVLYAASRTWVEGFRGDAIRGVYDVMGVSMSTSRLVAVGMVFGAAVIVAIQWRKGVALETPFVPEDDELI